ncbi:efflux transporter outer membrane subunit [Tichowtungia aerotolerans]|uniref:Efflux transporter outer membrane subunit n=1 Tax=Tichowtungia aerotolerans TaxID=2697043 RepID=A0A6P1M1N6_9BACT|nr:efflux transporter outer membrane subunit [Tichowtungia aerotolerans]QHI68022.1 efflux transporter outer membrane subunit [Tichowtungia aerotolerans]
MMKKMHSGLLLFAAAFAVFACSSCTILFGPDERETMMLPDEYRQAVDSAAVPNAWWTAFDDAQMTRLMERALGGNLTIEQAAARLRQAEAAVMKSGADRFPSLDATGDAQTRYTHTAGAGTSTADDFSLGLEVSRYEFDLWGRVASGHRAALAGLDASRFSLETAAMTISAETASAYFQWLYLNQRLAVLEKQLTVNRKMLSVVGKRFQTSSADALDVLQRRQQVIAAEAALPPVRASLAAAYNRLAILVGEPPQTDLALEAKALPALPERPDSGIPADLLARRPDLQREWALLAAADWNVSAARAARMPAIRLTGTLTTSNSDTDRLFDNWIGNLLAGLTMPLIDGGSLRADVARTRAAADEQLAAYREAVLGALGEVEDALSAETHQQEYVNTLGRQFEAAQQTATEAYRRYTRGLETYFEALAAETSRQNLEVSVLTAEYELLGDRIQLYRSLGGDWGAVLETVSQGENDER